MLSHQVNKEFLLQQLEKLPPDGLAEVAQFVEFLQFRQQKPVQKAARSKHTAFGMWADRTDQSADSLDYVDDLRRGQRLDDLESPDETH